MLFAEEDSIFSWPTAAVVLGFFVLVGFLSLLRERETRP